jgi:hypothetical protein
VPVFLMVTDCVSVTPTDTFSKLTLVGTTEIAGWTPTPESEMAREGVEALLTIFRLPVSLPTPLGENLTVRVRLLPPESVTAPEKPLTLKALPETEAWEMMSEPDPLLVKDTVLDAEAPTSASPKLKLVALLDSDEVPVPVPRPVAPLLFPVPVTGMETL